SGLLGYWAFDEGSGLTAADASGNNYTGALTNGPAWNATTPYDLPGYSLSFNGANAYVGATPAIGATATFSFWATWNGVQSKMPFALGTGTPGPDVFFAFDKVSWNTYDSGNNPFAAIPSN